MRFQPSILQPGRNASIKQNRGDRRARPSAVRHGGHAGDHRPAVNSYYEYHIAFTIMTCNTTVRLQAEAVSRRTPFRRAYGDPPRTCHGTARGTRWLTTQSYRTLEATASSGFCS